MSHLVECCTCDTSVDGKAILLDQNLCYQMFVSIYVNVCVCVCVCVCVIGYMWVIYSHNVWDE